MVREPASLAPLDDAIAPPSKPQRSVYQLADTAADTAADSADAINADTVSETGDDVSAGVADDTADDADEDADEDAAADATDDAADDAADEADADAADNATDDAPDDAVDDAAENINADTKTDAAAGINPDTAVEFNSGDQTDEPILMVPYPIEDSGADLLAQHPHRLGLFVAGRPKNYAFRENRNSVELAVQHLGYRVHEFSAEPAARPKDADDTAAAEAAATEKLAKALSKDASRSKLSFVFLKPQNLPWSRLENCLTFEPYHQLSLLASDKWNMAEILRRSSRRLSAQLRDANGAPFNHTRFTLYTANAGRNQAALLRHLDENPGVYVLKRTNSSQGIGISMFTSAAPNSVARLQRCAGAKVRLSRFVMQKYIERPLLIDKRKFDLRVYLLVLSCACPQRPGERGYLAFCHPGYVKLSSQAYVQASRDPRVHFTNQFVQRRAPTQYSQVKEATTWLPDELSAYLDRRGRTEAGWCRQRMYRQVLAIAGYLAAACRPHLESRRPGCVFRIYGPDLIVDEELQVQLLEFNCFPCYAKNTMALKASVSGMWLEAVAVATEAALCFREGRHLQGPRVPATGRNFRLVYSSESPAVLQDLVRTSYP